MILKQIALYISVLLLATSCYQFKKPEKPKNLISKDKMVNILIDVKLLASANTAERKTLDNFGIEYGAMTTIHDITNTQTIIDSAHKDLRRARSCGDSLIPTSSGSTTAIMKIFPELEGKLNGLAVRVPLTNASLVDLVVQTSRTVSVEEVNSAFEIASKGDLQDILGYEPRPLVSVDYKGDKRSAVIDALSTQVIGPNMVKVLAWYDNEINYVSRMRDIALMMAKSF